MLSPTIANNTQQVFAPGELVLHTLGDYERRINAAIVDERRLKLEMGGMLVELHDSGLWRQRSQSWIEYLSSAFADHFSESYCRHLMNLHKGLAELAEGYATIRPDVKQPLLPGTERVMRELVTVGADLPAPQRSVLKAQVWDAAVQAHGGEKPAYATVRTMVQIAKTTGTIDPEQVTAEAIARVRQVELLEQARKLWRNMSDATRAEFLEEVVANGN